MANDSYEVLVDQLTVHRQVGELTDPISGRVIGIQQGQGKTYFRGEVIPAEAVSPLLRDALDDEDNPLHESVSKRLKKSSSDESENTERRLGVPFAGYDEMDEDEILTAMTNLPSPTIQVIKRFEAQGEGRERIVNYSVGFGESAIDRQEGRVSSDLDEDNRGDESKAASRLTTREVPEEGAVQPGDGITGTGDPQIPHGSQKADEEDEDRPARPRRSRRQRSPKQQPSGDQGDGDSNE